MWKLVWRTISNPRTRAVLSFLGAGLIAIVGGLWAVYIHLEETSATKHSQELRVNQGFAAGHDVIIHGPVTVQGKDLASPTSAQGEPAKKLSAVLLRIFKSEAVLEIWRYADQRLSLLRTMPLCRWGGVFGPKTVGNRQAPEGFYVITYDGVKTNKDNYFEWSELLIRYPNKYDELVGHTGFGAGITSDCVPYGTFSLDTSSFEYLHSVLETVPHGTDVPVHIFPFRMTEEVFQDFEDGKFEKLYMTKEDYNKLFHNRRSLIDFWRMLQGGYQFVEKRLEIPEVYLLNRNYVFRQRANLRPDGATDLY